MIRSSGKIDKGGHAPQVGSVCRGLAFVFDLDGVIVNSNPVHTSCWRDYLRRCGVEPPSAFEQHMYGRRNDEIVGTLFGAGLDAAEVFRHGAEKEKLYRETMRPVLKEHLVGGLIAFLERHREVPMGVATNAERENADFVLDAGGLREYFRVVVDGRQVKRPKPDPEIYLRAAAELGVPLADCVVFEDSITGVAAARASGARVAGLTTTHDDLPQVDVSIRDFLDPKLEPWLLDQKPVA